MHSRTAVFTFRPKRSVLQFAIRSGYFLYSRFTVYYWWNDSESWRVWCFSWAKPQSWCINGHVHS